jgi:ribonuclease R
MSPKQKNFKKKKPSGNPGAPAERPGFTFVDRSGRVHGKAAASRSDDSSEKIPAKLAAKLSIAPARTSSALPPTSRTPDRFGGKSAPNKKRGGPDPFAKKKNARPGGPKKAGGKFRERFRDHHDEERYEQKAKGKPWDKPRDRGDDRPQKSFAPRTSGKSFTKYKATIDKNRKGFGFLIFENRELEDAFVPPQDADNLFHGDRVEVSVNSSDEVVAIDVLQHRFRELVGRFTSHPMGISRGGWVLYEQKRAREEVFIQSVGPEFIKTLQPEDWVRVKLEFHQTGPHPVTGTIVEVYGKELPPSADVGMIAAEFSLVEEHSEDSEREAREKKLEVPGKDLEGREDLRNMPFITVDGETARDFDDAIFVEKDKSGYILWVGIADVSHYVTAGSALDRDARSRGTSVYFPERAFHMLPRALSENLCSLKPHEPRLAMVAKMFFDRNGIIQLDKTELMEAVIQSKRRATYNEIQAEWDANKKNPAWEFAPQFELFELLRKVRQERGSIDFDLPEAELKVRPTGEVISILERPRIEAHRLIEEFMIAANEAVTEWALARDWPFLYRVHEEPASDSLEKFAKLAATVGVSITAESSSSPKIMADIVRKLDGHPAQFLLNMALLRSMKQAVYTSVHGIHYGLASNAYTHFTSPIRRYPDLVVHRMLRMALRTEKKLIKPLKESERKDLEQELTDVSEHCSYRERLASDAERESIKLKQVRAIQPHLGEEFDAKINGMIEPGIFVKLQNPFCEGLVAKESMMDDSYQFNEERMIFYGRRKKRTFKIGDPLRVQVIKADVERRQIDFGFPEESTPGNIGRVDRRPSS